MTLTFDFESESVLDPDKVTFGQIRVTLEVYASGTAEEPCVEVDGDPAFELLLCSPDTPETLITRAAFTELTKPVATHHPAIKVPNPAYLTRLLSLADFSLSDQRKLEALIERELNSLEDDGRASELAQEAQIARAEAYYDALSDR